MYTFVAGMVPATDFYDKAVIASSKTVLFHVAKPEERLIRCKGERRAEEDFNDIYKVLLECGPNLNVKFVVNDLSNMLPMKIKNVDISQLIKEI